MNKQTKFDKELENLMVGLVTHIGNGAMSLLKIAANLSGRLAVWSYRKGKEFTNTKLIPFSIKCRVKLGMTLANFFEEKFSKKAETPTPYQPKNPPPKFKK